MADKVFIEAGSGDPAHRYENARLQMFLSRHMEEMVGIPFLEVRDLEDHIVFGARSHMGMRHDGPGILGDMDPSVWGEDVVRRLSGREFDILPAQDAIRYAQDLHHAGKGLQVVDPTDPEHRYRVLGRMRSAEGCEREVQHVLGSNFRTGKAVILDGQAAGAQAERRFIFVDGALVTDTPTDFGLSTWHEDGHGMDWDAVMLENHRLITTGDPGITRAERALAWEIGVGLEDFTGCLDVAIAASGKPILTAAHQAHAGDYNLYGADLSALAHASHQHVLKIEAALEAADAPDGP